MGERKHPPVLYCGVRLTQNLDTYAIKADQSDYVESIRDPSTKDKDYAGELRRVVGSLIWPAHQTRPDLSFDVSSLGSKVSDAGIEDIRTAIKLIRRAKHYKDVGLTFLPLNKRWGEFVPTMFSDAGWATRPSGHSQGGNLLMLANPEIAGGKISIGKCD